MEMIIIADRQSEPEISQRAKGAIVIGAMPMPAETSETASARLLVNQLEVVAIIGAMKAPVAAPTSTP